MNDRDERTALYRFFTATLDPVYYGITNNPKVRFADHRCKKDWWKDVDERRTVIVWFSNRDAAAVAELSAISDENPQQNRVTTEGGTGRQPWGETASIESLGRLDAVVDLRRRFSEVEAEYRRKLAHLADKEGDAVPIAHLATRLGVERKTVYRHLGRSMT